jgi:hypothetical protein
VNSLAVVPLRAVRLCRVEKDLDTLLGADCDDAVRPVRTLLSQSAGCRRRRLHGWILDAEQSVTFASSARLHRQPLVPMGPLGRIEPDDTAVAVAQSDPATTSSCWEPWWGSIAVRPRLRSDLGRPNWNFFTVSFTASYAILSF